MNPVANRLTRLTLIGTVIGLTLLSTSALAQQKGAERLGQLSGVQAAQDQQSVEAGEAPSMSCPKCKDASVTVVERTFKNAHPEEVKATMVHLCPSCDTQAVSVGHGKAKTDKLVHTCQTCGSKDAFSCVMQKGEGPTKGMDH